jgi:hypothetical protein
VGRRAGDRESQKTCRLSRIVNNGKVAGSRYEDTEPLEVEESWVQALSLQKDSRLFLLGGIGFFVGGGDSSEAAGPATSSSAHRIVDLGYLPWN